MSGDWIKIEAATPDKPEVWLIADLLNIDPDAAFGKLFRVWKWFDEHTEDGNAPSVTKQLLNRLVGVTDFCSAMLQADWLLEADGMIWLPNFEKHNGATAKKRANNAKRVAKHRASSGDTPETPSKQNGNAQGVTDALSKEEKRREEKKDKSSKSKNYIFDEQHMKVAEWMRDRVQEVAPKQKEPNIESWSNTIRLMEKKDGLSLKEICSVFDWANKDSFWFSNILSPDKLREKFGELHANMTKKGQPKYAAKTQHNVDVLKKFMGDDDESSEQG